MLAGVPVDPAATAELAVIVRTAEAADLADRLEQALNADVKLLALTIPDRPNRVLADEVREVEASPMPPYTNEVEIRNSLGIESWRNLSKETFLRFLDNLPTVDREVGLKLIDQLPGITKLARGMSDDAAKAYDAALTSNARGQEMVHQVHVERLRIIKAELGKENLTPEERLRLLDEIRDVNSNALLKDTENKRFISAQFEKKLAAAGLTAVALIAIVFAAGSSGHKPTL